MPPRPDWTTRIQVAAGTLILWTLLVYGLQPYLMPRAGADAVVLLGSTAGTAGGLLAVALLFALTYALGKLIPLRDGSGPLLMLSLALVAWAVTGGTIDAWLMAGHQQVGPATSGPYLALLGDYALLALVVFALVVLFGYTGAPHAPDETPHALAADPAGGKGPLALLLMVGFSGALIYLLAGPQGHTYHGQVLFGVAVANWGAVQIARNLTGVHHALWYWPAPLIVGVLAVVLCAAQPKPPGILAGLNVIPAWGGLGRPLPVEMVGAGLAAILLTLPTRGQGANG